MELNQVKQVASKVMKVGITKIKIEKPEEAVQAMTKEDIRGMIKRGVISIIKSRQPSKSRIRKRAAQRKKGRRHGTGKRKGTQKARMPKKKLWMKKIRALRKTLNELKPKLKKGSYRKLYNMTRGGYFRTKDHLKHYVTEKEL